MPSLTIQIVSVAGQGQVAKLLRVLGPRTILSVIGARFLSHVDRQFRTRGEGAWAPLSPLTLMLRKHGGDAPLQDTGHYKQSFVQETDDQTYVEVGTNMRVNGVSLGMIHEFGTGPYTIRVRRAKVLAAQTRAGPWLFFGKEVQHPGIPARPVLPNQQTADRLVVETVDAMFEQAVKE